MSELVTIIYPVYNSEKFLCKSLNSIKEQTYNDIEVLMIDDGSTDDSPKIIDEFQKKDPRFKAIHIKNGGVSNARNVGLSQAKGEWITFVDSDDCIDSQYVEMLYNSAIQNEVEIARCSFIIRKYPEEFGEAISPESKTAKPFIVNLYEKKYADLYILSTVCASLIHMSLIKNLPKILFNTQYSLAEDFLFMTQVLSKVDKYVYCPMQLYAYTDDSNSKSLSKSKNDEKGFQRIKAVEEACKCFEKDRDKTIYAKYKSFYGLICYNSFKLLKTKELKAKYFDRFLQEMKLNRKYFLRDASNPKKTKILYVFATTFPRLFLVVKNLSNK